MACAQDETGALREKTSDDYVSLQLKLVPRIAARGCPAWAAEERTLPAHVLIATKGYARIESQLVLSGSRGGAVISIGDGSLKVTDAAGKVRRCSCGSCRLGPFAGKGLLARPALRLTASSLSALQGRVHAITLMPNHGVQEDLCMPEGRVC
jgi:hypothetical protein